MRSRSNSKREEEEELTSLRHLQVELQEAAAKQMSRELEVKVSWSPALHLTFERQLEHELAMERAKREESEKQRERDTKKAIEHALEVEGRDWLGGGAAGGGSRQHQQEEGRGLGSDLIADATAA
eukprot:267485-Hanusia_phi.AAC.2